TGATTAALAPVPAVGPRVDDEKTPITDLGDTLEAETLTLDTATATRNVSTARAQRPTKPIVDRRRRADVPLEDLPTPIADPVAQLRANQALIPLEDRPTPVADPPLPLALPLPPERPTPPERPPRVAATPSRPMPAAEARTTRMGTGPKRPPRPPTGPQIPNEVPIALELEDAPTEIGPAEIESTLPDRDDPTDVAEAVVVRFGPRTETAQVARPPVKWGTAHLATAVVSRMRPRDLSSRSWLLLCGLFVIAVLVACAVALL